MNAICLVIDRLHAGFLGAYANAWVATPALDRLAAESFVFDQAYLESPSLPEACRSLWTGRHPLDRRPMAAQEALPARLAAGGVATTLVTDDSHVASHALAASFHEIVRLDIPHASSMAADVEETAFAQFFSAAADWLAAPREPFCLWLHCGLLDAIWDAPRAFRERYVDDDGIGIPEFTTPPTRTLPPDFDPDELLPLRWAYAAQVSLLDLCLAALLDQLRDSGLAERTLMVLTSPRGYPLGEHRQVGARSHASRRSFSPVGHDGGIASEPSAEPPALCEPLHEELIHLPLVVRVPGGRGAAARSQALVQPADVAVTLEDWFGAASRRDHRELGDPDNMRGTDEPHDEPGSVPHYKQTQAALFGKSLLPIVREEIESLRDRLCLHAGPNEHGVRTPAWYLRTHVAQDPLFDSASGSDPQRERGEPPNSPAPQRQLYAKPDDRWERNDVATRCADVVEQLAEVEAATREAIARGDESPLAPLADELARGLT